MKLLLLFALLLGCRPARAQSADTLAPRLPAVAQAAPPDTAAALHRLFAHKRRIRSYVVAGTALAVAATAAVVASQPEHHGSPGFGVIEPISPGEIAGVLVGGIGVPIIIGELLYYGQYSRRNEARALELLRVHQLPHYLRRKLKPKYFAPLTGS